MIHTPTSVNAKRVTHVMIVACYHPLPLSERMVYFDLVSILFGTIPTSFNILVKMFLHLYILLRVLQFSTFVIMVCPDLS